MTNKPSYQELENQNKKFANELITANKRINEAQNIAHLGIWELDIVNNKLSWSDEIFRIFDCEPDEFEATYEAFLEFVYPEDRDKVNIAYKNSLKTKTSYEIEHRLLTKTKSIKYVKEKCITDFDENGRPVKSFGIVSDITSEKQLIENLHRSKVLLESSMESPKNMIILSLDKDYRYMFFNKAHKEAMHHVFGTQPQVGNCIFDFVKGKGFIENAKAHYDRALSGEGHISIEENLEGHTNYYFETQYNPVYNEKNEIVGVTAFAQDITERKKNEVELLFHSQILMNIGDGVCLVEAATSKIVFCNLAFENMFGYNTNELLGKHIQVVNAPTDKTPNEIAIEIIEKLNKNGKWEGEIANIKKDKSVFYCSATVSTFEHPKFGNVWITIHKDITEQREAEQSIKESELRLKYAMSATKDGIWDWDIKSKRVFYSQGWIEILGLKNVEFNFETWESRLHPDEKEAVLHTLEKSLTGNSDYWEYDHRIKTTNDKWKWVKGKGEIVEKDIEGNPLRMVGTMTDIDYQKKAEKQLLKAKEKAEESEGKLQNSLSQLEFHTKNTPLAFVEFNNKFQITKWSNTATKIFGWSANEVLGKNIEEFRWVHEEDAERVSILSAKMLKSKKTNNLHTNRNYRKDGTIITCEWYNSALIDNTGALVSVHSFILDISERRVAEQALKVSETRLRDLNSTKDKFFSIIAHDLRSPFTHILGFSKLLINEVNSLNVSESEKYLHIINSSAKKTLVLLDNLLSWAQFQTGKINFNPEKQVSTSIFKEVIELLNPSAKNKKILLNYTLSEEIIIFADLNMIKTILRNLISNAIKFTNSYGKIDVYALKNDNYIEIAVSDNGIGMNEETKNKLFRFETNESTIGTANEKGSGLGLILCTEFVKKHGGKIWVESELGKGSVFKFTLPLNKSE